MTILRQGYFEACTPDERTIFTTFLLTGIRDKEAARWL
jgi:hypothetical protein